MAGRSKIARVKGTDPEKFVRVWLDSELPSGTFMETGHPQSEAELRAELKKDGRSESEINSIIERARRDEAWSLSGSSSSGRGEGDANRHHDHDNRNIRVRSAVWLDHCCNREALQCDGG